MCYQESGRIFLIDESSIRHHNKYLISISNIITSFYKQRTCINEQSVNNY